MGRARWGSPSAGKEAEGMRGPRPDRFDELALAVCELVTAIALLARALAELIGTLNG
jgi:hypothetical protein